MNKMAMAAFANAASSPSAVASASCATTTAMNAMSMPWMGLGTMGMDGSEEDNVRVAIRSALSAGYRRIDCAPVYFNEAAIGNALAEVFSAEENNNDNDNEEEEDEHPVTNLKREDVFITSKLASPFHRPEHVEPALRKTLSDLRLTFLDLYLIHWPVAFHYVPIPEDPNMRGWEDEAIDDSNGGLNIDPNVSIHDTWSAMEDLVAKGLVKHIGVSNFPVALLHELLTRCQIRPYVNQVEMHPYLQQASLVSYCQARGVHVQAYSPLGTPGYKEQHEPSVLEDPVLQNIALKHGWTVSQLSLVYSWQRGCSVVVKSSNAVRQKENFLAWSLFQEAGEAGVLTREEMAEIAELDRGFRFFRPEDWWGSMHMAVFD